jgi:hypothetical protein
MSDVERALEALVGDCLTDGICRICGNTEDTDEPDVAAEIACHAENCTVAYAKAVLLG